MSNKDNDPSVTPTPDPEDLLQQIMPKLGMEAADPTGRYKNQARTRYLLPKILALCVVLLLIVGVVFVLLLPARFQDVELTEAPDEATLNFRMDRLMLLESVTATQDGRPVSVTMLGAGAYQLQTRKNGELNVVARTFTDRYVDLSMTIDCIDETPPSVDRDQLEGDTLYVYLTDGDAGTSSGINWDTLNVTMVDGGEPYGAWETDTDAGCVSLPLPDQSIRIYVEDNNGNPLSLRLDRPAAGD